MGLIQILIKDPLAFVILSVLLLYSVIFHELAHGWVAYKMGDPTAKLLGRLTLNPVKHLDPIGTLMLLIIGFGWAKPVTRLSCNLNPILKEVFAVLTKILGNVRFYLLCALRECALI